MASDIWKSARVLSDLLDAQAGRRPDAEALLDGRRRLSWVEYAAETSLLAGALRDLGVVKGDRVAVHLPKSVESFLSVHAIIRLGAIAVPVDWFAPPEYARGVLIGAEACAMVSSAPGPRLVEIIAGTGIDAVLNPIGDLEALDGVRIASTHDVTTSRPAARANVDPTDAAYIVFTSGSTGRPKGITHTHRSGLEYARRAVETYGLKPSDRLANIAPLHFDQSTFELYAGPLAGAAALVVSDGVMRFPASLSKLIADERITVWYSVPFALQLLNERGVLAERDLSPLRWVLFGGETFPASVLATLMRQLPQARFSNVYGPAEVNQCTFHHLDEPPSEREVVPIGEPWADTDVVIVDESGSAVVDDQPGELWVSTSTMMSGYWGDSDLTEASIVERDTEDIVTRWYRTGDLVSRRADGKLVFNGRVDHQVKVRGHRIELEAVELVLGGCHGVEACSVVVEDGERLAALVVPEHVDGSELLRAVRDRLPPYAVPHAIVGVESLPRTGTGKVDRRAAAHQLADFRARSPVPEGDAG